MSNFTRLENAERMAAKYEMYALYADERYDFEKAEKYYFIAGQIQKAIYSIMGGCATENDRQIINSASNERALLDDILKQ